MKIIRAVTALLFALAICMMTAVLCGTDEADENIANTAGDSVPALSDSVSTAQYTSHAVRTDGVLANKEYPCVFIARSAKDVAKYRRVYENVYDFSYGAMNECAGSLSFDDIAVRYGDAYFENGALIITACTAPPTDAPVFDGIGADGFVILTVGEGKRTAGWHVITEIPYELAAEVHGARINGTVYAGYAAFSRVW